MNGFQGDVIFVTVENAPKLGKRLERLVLAEGETTGHKHQIVDGICELYDIPNTVDKFLRVISDKAEVKHEEHNTVVLPKGDYIVKIAKEYDYDLEETRQVRD